MTSPMTLTAASRPDGRAVYDMLQEIGPGENGFGNSAFGVSYGDFAEYLESLERMAAGIGLKEGLVPQTTYWLRLGTRPVGIGHLRHRLTDALLERSGHIGFCIRPSERGKGYGTALLRLILEKAREMDIPRALLTCNADNLGSRRIIERNGGTLERVDEERQYCYYWIACGSEG